MANTYEDYTGDGSNTDFAITFDYIKTSHVAVEINDGPAGGTNVWVRKTLTSDYTVVTSPSKKVVFNSAPANLVKVRVLRDSDANTGIVDFANGSVLTETELDNSYNHNRYLAEEAEEGITGGSLVKNTSGQFDADGLRLENLAAPDSDDDAVNKGYADGRYVDEAGDTMSGALTLPNSDPTDGNHATRKTYVDAEIATALATGVAGGPIDTVNVADDAITYAKLQNVAANNVLLGNDNGAGVDVQELTAAEARTLLNVEDGATANDTDANLKNRANHTGTQTAATISDFDTEVANNTAVAANTAKVSNATHTGDATGSTALTLATVNSNVGSFTNANITVNAKGLITAASNGSGVSKYSTGWQNSIDSVTVANGSTHTITHSLGTDDVTTQVFVATSSAGANSRLIANSAEVGSSGTVGYGAQIQSFGTNSVELQLGSGGYYELTSSGTINTGTSISFASKYIKVVVIG